MGRPAKHDETTREALLAAAEQLLAGEGPDGLSIRAIADATGTSTRAVYALFGGKDALLSELFARGFTDLGRRVRALPTSDSPTDDLVRAGTDGFRGFALARPNLFRLAFNRERTQVASKDAQMIAVKAFDALVERVQRCAAAGRLGDRDPHEVAWQFHALCQGLADLELRDRLPPNRAEAMWHDAVSALVRGYDTGHRR